MRFFLDAIGRKQAQQRLPDHLRGRVAEDALGGGVPALHDAVEILADDRVVGGSDDRVVARLELGGVGDVADDLRRTDHAPVRIADRRHRDRHEDAASALVRALGAKVLDALASAQAREDVELFVAPLGWDDPHELLADHLVGTPAEDALGRGVPALHDASEVLADDAVVRRDDDRGESCVRCVGLGG